jgi:hypothetical protein
MTPLGRGYAQPVALRDAPVLERPLVDLERSAVVDLRVVERTRIGLGDGTRTDLNQLLPGLARSGRSSTTRFITIVEVF